MSEFFFAGNMTSVAGVRYHAVNAELEGAEANIRLGPAVIDGRVRPDSPIVGMYVQRDHPGAPTLETALAEVRDYKLDELSQQRADGEGMHH